MSPSDKKSILPGLSRRGFLGAAAGATALALDQRIALAQSLASGRSALTIDDIRGWGHIPGIVDIGDNENPYGPSPAAVRAIAETMFDLNRYDDDVLWKLEHAIGRHVRFPEIEPPGGRFAMSNLPIYAECSSTFILFQVALHYGIRNGSGGIIEAEPAYGGVSGYVREYNRITGSEVTIRRIPTTDDFRHDLGAMLAAVSPDTTLIVVTNPNNPTGTIVPRADIERFIVELPSSVTVLIDEAYIDFVREPGYQDCIDLSQRYPNVIVTRTLSKVYGLAGLRVGYATAQQQMIDELRLYGNTQGLSNVACYGAIAALDDHDFVRRVLKSTNEVKDWFYSELDTLGLHYVPSHTSFVLVNVGSDGAELLRRMAARNVMISRLGMATDPRVRNFVRFSMGTPDEMQVTLNILREELGA